MSSTAFEADFGAGQGRCVPAGWTPPDGAVVYVLGHDLPGVVRNFATGDYHEISQDFTVDAGAAILRFRARVRPPAAVSPAPVVRWALQLLVDGTAFYEVPLPFGGAERDLADLCFPVQGLSTARVAVRLALLGGASGATYDVELPGVYVDAFAEDDSAWSGISGAAPAFGLRSPEPGETSVPALPTITVGAFSLDNGEAELDVYVDGSLVAKANDHHISMHLAGWTVTNPAADPWHGSFPLLILTPPAAYASQQVVSVTAVARSGYSAGTWALTSQASWTFTIADTVGPVIASAIAGAPTEVTIAFDEPVLDGAGGGAALLPESYVLALVAGAPAVTPSVVAVTAIDAATVVLGLDKIMTRRATYAVTATVTDAHGNAAAASTQFSGYEEPWPAGRELDLYEALPEQLRREDETRDLWNVTAMVQEVVDVLLALADRWMDIVDPDLAPEPWVDAMLDDMGNPFAWAVELSLIEKRKLVQMLLRIYKSKGTGPGIVDAVRLFLGVEVTINVYAWAPYPIGVAIIGQTWVLGSSAQSDLYTFEVLVPQFLTTAERTRLNAIVDYMKTSHEHHVIREPTPPAGAVDHWQLGYSHLGVETLLH